MGEVYRARDTKLNREVALKVLPELFALDLERLARFKREAQVLASLNHPNIGAIYGFEDSPSTHSAGSGQAGAGQGGASHALVLELIEGPTLPDRIAQGPIALPDALLIAKQIAAALEAAHEHGIVHRDLKPANVKVKDDGTVKVLDFGLAKMMDPVAKMMDPVGHGFSRAGGGAAEAVPHATPPADSPTITTPAMTQMGMILGTAADGRDRANLRATRAQGRGEVATHSSLHRHWKIDIEAAVGRAGFDLAGVAGARGVRLRDWADPTATRAAATAGSEPRVGCRCPAELRIVRLSSP